MEWEDPWHAGSPHAPRRSGHDSSGRWPHWRWSSASHRSPPPVSRAATMSGHDISWPQCPTSVGGYGLPMPPTTTPFVVVGLTKGLPFTREPVPGQPGAWMRAHGRPAQAYTMAAFPTAAQLATYRAKGPWSSRTRAGQLSNVGYAEAHVRGRGAEAGRLRAARGLDRRRAAARPALADRHRLAAAREPLRRRGPDARRCATRGPPTASTPSPPGGPASPAPGGCPASRSGRPPAGSTTPPRPRPVPCRPASRAATCTSPSGTTTPATTT